MSVRPKGYFFKNIGRILGKFYPKMLQSEPFKIKRVDFVENNNEKLQNRANVVVKPSLFAKLYILLYKHTQSLRNILLL